jgi:hypothetical protein
MAAVTDPKVRAIVRRVQERLTDDNYDQRSFGGIALLCDTPCCIAGHVVRAAIELGYLDLQQTKQSIKTRRGIGNLASALIGIEPLWLPGYPHLFSSDPVFDWPTEFSQDWHYASRAAEAGHGDGGLVDVAKRRLEFFLAEGR